MRILCVRCSVQYTGRIDAELELGDRTILLMQCGALVIHAVQGLKPKNWMPSGSVYRLEPGMLISENHKTGEKLEVYIEKVFQDIAFPGTLSGKLIKMGSEREFSDLLSTQLWRISDNVELIAREFRTPVGPIDILCENKLTNTLFCVEVKRAKVAGVEVPYQLLRYLDALGNMEQFQGMNIQGLLVSPSISNSAKAAAEELKMPFIRVRYEEMMEWAAENALCIDPDSTEALEIANQIAVSVEDASGIVPASVEPASVDEPVSSSGEESN